MQTANGQLDLDSGFILPTNAGTWAQLSGATWASWTVWNNTPVNPMIWVTETIVVPFSTTYNLKIETLAQGEVSYEVYTSTTGLFEGEESTTVIAAGAATVPSFTGNFVKVAVIVTNTGQATVLQDTRITATDFTIDVLLNSVDTSTLAGTAGNRTLTLPRTISGILNMSVVAQDVTAYTPNVYVTDITTTQFVTAVVTDKDATAPKVGVFGIDGYARDAVVDVRIRALPASKMVGNNLVTQ